MPKMAAFHQSALFANIKTIFRDGTTSFYRNFEWWPLKIQNGQFHTYWINMYRVIHHNACLIWFFTFQSTIFQLCWDGPSWVEPVLSKDICVLLKDTTVDNDANEARTHGPSVLSQALYHWAIVLPLYQNEKGLLSYIMLGPNLPGLQIRVHIRKLFSLFLIHTYVVGTQKNRLNETVLLSIQNTCLTLKAPRKKMHLKMPSAEFVCCK